MCAPPFVLTTGAEQLGREEDLYPAIPPSSSIAYTHTSRACMCRQREDEGSIFVLVYACMCVCVCVCVNERRENVCQERQRKRRRIIRESACVRARGDRHYEKESV